MPQPNTVDLSGAPGGDFDLDDIFQNPEVTPTTATEDQTPTPTETTPVDESFLKTATGTVYKSQEDAVKGIEHKDTLIAQLRQELAAKTGSDPLKKPPEQTGPTNYLQDNETYFKDLSKAVETKDQARYMEVQRKFVFDSLAPLAPTLTSLMKEQAANVVESEVKGFRQFVTSEDYTKTLDSFPLLKEAIRVAESNPESSQQLPEFYKMAYYASQGARVPEIVRASTNRTAEPVRPTVSSSPIPPSTSGNRVVTPSLNTSEGRKAIIEQQERAGVQDLRM